MTKIYLKMGPMTAARVREFVNNFGPDRIAEIAGSHRNTVARWGRKGGRMPTPAQEKRIIDHFEALQKEAKVSPTSAREALKMWLDPKPGDWITITAKGGTILKSGHSINTETGEMLNASQQKIAATCDAVKSLLLEKNAKYGDSALNPRRIFSRADAVEQILVRVDDKLSRMGATGFVAADEDTLQDLIGYLILLKVALGNTPEASR
jgi:hypothetical protein